MNPALVVEVTSTSTEEYDRGMHMSGGWNPTWHQPIGIFATFSDKDFRLGLDAARRRWARSQNWPAPGSAASPQRVAAK